MVRHRSREKTWLHPAREYRDSNPDGSWNSWTSLHPAYTSLQEWESISDSSGFGSDFRLHRRTNHPVTHEKLVWSAQRQPTFAYDIVYPWYVQEYRPGTNFDVGISRAALAALAFPPLPSQWLGDWSDEAATQFSTQIPQEVDLPNFLLDLREIGSLIPTLQDNMAKTVGGGYLTYSFGWKPFIGDLQKLGHLSETVRKRLNWLQRTRGQKVRLGFQRSFDVSSIVPSNPWSGSAYTGTLVSSSGLFRANGTLYHELERLGGIEGHLRAFSGALGLLNPSAVAWERIPFSFVIDWFGRTKAITDSVSFRPFPGRWEIDNLTHSFTTKCEWQVVASGYSLAPFKNAYVGTLVAERYVRDVGLPVSSTWLRETEPTSGQLKLIAALLGAASK